MSIYYLGASLPIIEFETKLPMSTEDFLGECRKWLSERDCKDIEDVVLARDTAGRSGFAGEWSRFTQDLRNESVWFRAEALNRDPFPYLQGERSLPDRVTVDTLTAASKAEDPLAAEKILDEFCWHRLDQLGTNHIFDIESLMVYGLKLRILERYAGIGTTLGQQRFKELKVAAALQY